METGWATFWASLDKTQRNMLADEYATSLERDGLTVFRAADERFIPIPTVLSPEPISPDLLRRLGDDARLLLSAVIKVAQHSLTAEGRFIAALLYGSFTPLEKECLSPARLAQVSTARVDYFLDPSGTPRALELNATIPAMQGYSDLIAHRFVRLFAAMKRRSAEQLQREVGSSTADLLASLVAHYQLLGGRQKAPSIVVVSRRGDAQLGELHHYVRAFSELGHRTVHAFVDELSTETDGRLSARGERFDLLYRHIFARRVDPASTLAKLLRDPGPNVILNPVVSPLEVKGMLALIHEAKAENTYGFSDDEMAAIERIVPWTRILRPGPGTLPDGSVADDLPAWVLAHRDMLVLKRSWDYGGKSVILGPDSSSWADEVRKATVDPDPFVVQEFVKPRLVKHLLLERDAIGRLIPTWREMYVDISAYANHGVDVPPRGGVCRASGSKIVNILGGGGLTPLIPTTVLRELFP